jgi:hypothetical protein
MLEEHEWMSTENEQTVYLNGQMTPCQKLAKKQVKNLMVNALKCGPFLP